jgi:hypothetical protein
MCVAFDGNKLQVCTVGDLRPGEQYRTPDGNTQMVLNLAADRDGFVRVADTQGQVTSVANSIKLGTDRQGRLYASRYLNPQPAPLALAMSKQ